MKPCPKCNESNIDTAKYCAECGSDIQAVESKPTCWVVIVEIGGKYNVRGNEHPDLEQLLRANDNMMHLLTGLFVIHCYTDQLKHGRPFRPLEMNKISLFGKLQRVVELRAVTISQPSV